MDKQTEITQIIAVTIHLHFAVRVNKPINLV